MSDWRAETGVVAGGCLYRIMSDGALTFHQLFELLRTNEEFADWYSATLAAFEATAFYWEFPPLTCATLDEEAEFVLIDAPMLARLPAEPQPFAAYFDNEPDRDIVVFPNLGGDAILIVPAPRGPVDAYPHFAAFLRNAEPEQVRSLWRVTAETVLDNLSDSPTWLSTAGGGVYWLHLRLDSRPKYYSHGPYTASA